MAQAPILALVGGGRWARIYLSVLTAMPLPFRIAVVTRHGADRFATARDASGEAVRVFRNIDALLSSGRPAGAIVANAALSHADSALRLLDARVPVLVEKPAAASMQDAAALAQAAAAAGVALMPALTFMHCAYLENFARVLSTCHLPASPTLVLEWVDAAAEARYGEVKTYDHATSAALDVLPHAWSVLTSVLGRQEFRIESCRAEEGGRRVLVRLDAAAVACELRIEREGVARRRMLSVAEGPSIDFTNEPGTIASAEGQSAGDAGWGSRTDRPVRRQVESFLRALSAPPDAQALADLEQSVRLASHCDALIKAQQRQLLAASGVAAGLDDAVARALRELLAPVLVGAGQLRAGDNAGLLARVAALREEAPRSGALTWLDAVERARL